MKNIQDITFDWVVEFIEVELSKLWAKENVIDINNDTDYQLYIDNRMGVEYIESFLNRNQMIDPGNQRNLLETLINIYKYIKMDRVDIQSNIEKLQKMIRSAQWIDDYASELEYVNEISYLKEVLITQDNAFIIRFANLNSVLQEFIRVKGIEFDLDRPKNGVHFGQLQVE